MFGCEPMRRKIWISSFRLCVVCVGLSCEYLETILHARIAPVSISLQRLTTANDPRPSTFLCNSYLSCSRPLEMSSNWTRRDFLGVEAAQPIQR